VVCFNYAEAREERSALAELYRELKITLAGPLAEHKVMKGKPRRPYIFNPGDVSPIEYGIDDDTVFVPGDELVADSIAERLVTLVVGGEIMDDYLVFGDYQEDQVVEGHKLKFLARARGECRSLFRRSEVWRAVEQLAALLRRDKVVRWTTRPACLDELVQAEMAVRRAVLPGYPVEPRAFTLDHSSMKSTNATLSGPTTGPA
jgi:hypothetical protein